ncbi:folylpolyglutamate synthase [Ascosphaera aggregata]|nr:folylpolyglutamate synthase [Ascosphaera aggregata]
MIELGLQRISRLIQHIPISWKAIHVADRWDCITIDNRTVAPCVFFAVEEQIKLLDKRLGVGATEFELLTATAFRIFEQEKIDIGVIEVGLGGTLDATNVLRGKEDVLVSVISRIALDHQNVLGQSLSEIAREKAGIMKKDVMCVVDAVTTMDDCRTAATAAAATAAAAYDEVLKVLEKCASNVGAPFIPVTTESAAKRFPCLTPILDSMRLEPHQRINVSVAVTAAQLAIEAFHRERHAGAGAGADSIDQNQQRFQLLSPSHINSAIATYLRPGRQQLINLRPLLDRATPILLDGAHNPQSAEVLSRYVETRIRRGWSGGNGDDSNGSKPLTWVLAMSEGKSVEEILGTIIKAGSGDFIATVEFGEVDGMPWVKAHDSKVLIKELEKIDGLGEKKSFGRDVKGALKWAENKSNAIGGREEEGSIAIAGSLYLVGEILREKRREEKMESHLVNP